jgi:glycosyltransferase involved in cell wall biosynthesis
MHMETRLNVLFIVNSLCFGGAEKHTVTLINGLDAARFNLSLAYLKQDETLLPQIDHQRLPGKVFCCQVRYKVDRRAIGLLTTYIKDMNIDIIVCTNTYSLLYGWLARMQSGRRPRVVEVFHTTEFGSSLKDGLQMMFYWPFIGISHMLVYVSENQRKFWRARGLRARKEVTIRNGIDAKHFTDCYTSEDKSRLRQRYGFSDADYIIGLCAAMRPEKAHCDLLEAIAIVRAAGVNVKCLLIGDGPERQRIERNIDAVGLRQCVRITGFMEDVRPAIAACDAIALVSHVETFSIAALEAMALGKPVLMSKIGGADEQVDHGVHGLLFTPHNIDELAKQILTLVRSGASSTMGQLARKRVLAQFTLDHMLGSYHALFDSLAAGGGK